MTVTFLKFQRSCSGLHHLPILNWGAEKDVINRCQVCQARRCRGNTVLALWGMSPGAWLCEGWVTTVAWWLQMSWETHIIGHWTSDHHTQVPLRHPLWKRERGNLLGIMRRWWRGGYEGYSEMDLESVPSRSGQVRAYGSSHVIQGGGALPAQHFCAPLNPLVHKLKYQCPVSLDLWISVRETKHVSGRSLASWCSGWLIGKEGNCICDCSPGP